MALYSIWASLVAQLVKNPPAMLETWVRSLGWEDPLEKRKGYPLQYSGLENSVDCIVHVVAKLDMTERFHTLYMVSYYYNLYNVKLKATMNAVEQRF